MDRRDLLKLAGGAALARFGAGCDRLVVMSTGDGDIFIDPVTSNAAFYVYACCGVPDIDPATHETAITHEGVELARITPAFLQSLSLRTKEHTLMCIGSTPRIQNISNAVWGGLPLTEVLDALGVTVPSSAVGLKIVGADAYDAGLPIEDLIEGPIWLVWEMNGEALPMEHGAPARLLVPGKFGVKNLKWLDEIAFVDEPHVSWWTTRGWDEAATYKPNTLIASPLVGTPFVAGQTVRVVGTAYAGRDPVTAVDVRVDDGPWVPASLDYAPGTADIWALWSFDWVAESGTHTVQARCTTESGGLSEAYAEDPNRFDGWEGSMSVTLEVV